MDAPLILRHKRFLQKYKNQPLSLEQFVGFDDKIKFNSEEFQMFHTTKQRQLRAVRKAFHNKTENILDFYHELRQFQFNNQELVRPSFDTYFLRLAEVAASRSNCMKSGIGAVIAKDSRVISTGYNGTPGGLTNCN